MTPITGEKLLGGGYTDPTGSFYKPIVTSQGVYQYVSTPELLAALKASGAPLFFQSSEGVFTPAPAGGVNAPIYQQLPGVPYSPSPVANPGTTAAVNGSPTAASTLNRQFWPFQRAVAVGQ